MAIAASKRQSEPVPGAFDPIVLTDVSYRGKTLRFREPFTLFPGTDDETHCLIVDSRELNMTSWGRNRAELLADIRENVHIVWKLYALADDMILDLEAREVKRRLRSLMEEMDCAAS